MLFVFACVLCFLFMPISVAGYVCIGAGCVCAPIGNTHSVSPLTGLASSCGSRTSIQLADLATLTTTFWFYVVTPLNVAGS